MVPEHQTDRELHSTVADPAVLRPGRGRGIPAHLAMRDIPVGTAYAVFTGIGAVGAITLGVLINHDPVTAGRLAALALIVAGVILAHLVTA